MLDSRTQYYLKFATSINIRCQQGILADSIIVYLPDDSQLDFDSLQDFGTFLKQYCFSNNFEFKPYKPGRGRGGARINSGGKRQGSGHPLGKPSPGSGRKPGWGRYGDEGGRLAWIPAQMSIDDIERYRSMDDELIFALNKYEQLANQSKMDSKTGKPTRDWTQALRLIDELRNELLGE